MRFPFILIAKRMIMQLLYNFIYRAICEIASLKGCKCAGGFNGARSVFCLNGGLPILKGVMKCRLLQHPFQPHVPSLHGRPLLSASVKAAVLRGNLYRFSL